MPLRGLLTTSRSPTSKLRAITGQQCCADHSGIRPQLRLYDPAILKGRRECILTCEITGVAKQQFARCHDSAADNDHLRIEQIDEICACDTEPPAGIGENLAGDFIATNRSVVNLSRGQ